MKIRVITLHEATERQQRIKSLFDSKNISFEFVDGTTVDDFVFSNEPGFEVYGKNYKINEKNLKFYTNRLWIRFGEIAALMAHKKLWEQLLSGKEDFYFICEDDCSVSEKFSIDEVKSFDFSKFDLLYLQAVTAHYQNKFELLQFYPETWWDKRLKMIDKHKGLMFEGFAGYCISRSGAKKAIEYIEKNGYDGPIDNLVCHIPDFISVCPSNIQDYLYLDDTSKYSYTHNGNFVFNYQLNKVDLQSKKELRIAQ